MAKGGGPTILDRFLRRGRKEETTDGGGDDASVSSGDASDSDSGDGGDVTATGDGGTATGDGEVGGSQDDSSDGVVGEDDASQDSDVTNNDGSGAVDDNANVATGDGTQTGDVVDDANVATGNGNVVTGDDNQQAIDSDGDIDTGPGTGDPADLDVTPERLDLGLVRNARIGAQESSFADDAQLIKDATDPQLDPAIIEARLGGKGPPSPDPDDTPDDLGFGTGASWETQQPAGSILVNVDPEVPAEAPEGVPDDGFNDVGQELSDTGLDPVGAAPPGGGLGPHEVQFDDPGPHNDPTEVDID